MQRCRRIASARRASLITESIAKRVLRIEMGQGNRCTLEFEGRVRGGVAAKKDLETNWMTVVDRVSHSSRVASALNRNNSPSEGFLACEVSQETRVEIWGRWRGILRWLGGCISVDGTDLSNYDSNKSRRGIAAVRKIGRPAQLECKDGPDVE
jgi:hypothetical protein